MVVAPLVIGELMTIKQKYVRRWKERSLLAESGGTSYFASQVEGASGLEKDLADGWIIKYYWEDKYLIVLIMERAT